MKRFHWQVVALSTLSFSVSIENSDFMVATPFFFPQKNVFLNFKMSTMHVNHSRVAVDLEKILQCGREQKSSFFSACDNIFPG